ncbi:FdhD protein [Variovorax sp. TBS-050B]|uniref:formate dehydrogenase accessory sulfurtransferase FdhD n=1 Tax=Variovorax sp. TBS-050B TaxID=2940551 RepID=UPI002476F738|nr:formate dehydrogenase accessory sulfurtransferase FdhD [Variovorax sp. TBS-050B]MDH6594137.1 FdhD protein [Variovorax sp. TBS-050B]
MNLADLPPRPGGAELLPVRGLRARLPFDHRDWVAEEVPVALEFNGIAHAVMLATPLDLADFALGFSLAEGILAHRGELYGIDEEYGADGITLRMEVASAAFARLKDRRRSMAGRTGCGLCGAESLAHVTRTLAPLPAPAEHMRLAPEAVARGMRELAAAQVLQKITGAVHAAAWCSADGELRLMREDVGRHNALDKLVGALAKAEALDPASGFVAVTSRASFEMVQKTVAAGVPLLAAVSASTSMAAAVAQAAGLTLAGFVRGDDLVVYTHPGRLRGLPAQPAF